MPITELIFPSWNPDPQSLARLKEKQPEIFQSFSGVEGLEAVLSGPILEENGTATDPKSVKTIIVLEWTAPSFFHAFYPNSQKFENFFKLAKPFVAGPSMPQLYEAGDRSSPCTTSNITQIIKAKSSKTSDEAWAQLVGSLENSLPNKPLFHSANGIEKDEGTFIGLIGWSSWEEYERVGKTSSFLERVKAIDDGEVFRNVIAELKRAV